MAIFSNKQWDVTDYGIEARKPEPTYEIDKTRLTETADRGYGELYDWPIHMAEKSWVNLEAFIEAFTQALMIHAGAYEPKADLELLKMSADRARLDARELR